LPPTPPEPPESRQPQPPWFGPPENVLGVSVPLEPLLLVRSDEVAVALGGFVAYPEGVEFAFAVRRRRVDDDDDWLDVQMHGRRRGRELPPEFLRFGVELSDGRKATNLRGWHTHVEQGEHTPDGPILIERGGNGGATHLDQRYWLWPLPPPGRLSFVAEWPSQGVALTRADIDAAPIIEASTRATTLWEPSVGPEGGVTSSGRFSSYPELST
jgi:hypothetical protein